MSTTLTVIEKITAVEFFKPGASSSLIEKLESEARAAAACFDVSTPAGEDGLRSLAASLGKAKNRIDKARVELVSGEKKRLKIIDTEGGVVWDRIEALQKEVRQPLTDKEEAEKKRIATHEFNIVELSDKGNYVAQNWQEMTAGEMRASLQTITNSKYDWQEFLSPAQSAGMKAITQIREAIARREKMDADAAELEVLRAEKAKQDQAAREAQIALAAKEAAEAVARKREEEQRAAAEAERERIEDERVQAEARAKHAEAQRVAAVEKSLLDAKEAEERLQNAAREKEEAEQRHDDELKESQERSERERITAEAWRIEQEERIAKRHAEDMAEAEELRKQEAKDAEEREKSIRQLAAEKAERDRVAAVEAERQRAAEVLRKEQEATAAREANRKHAAKINGEVRDAIIKAVSDASIVELTEIQVTAIVVAIAKGLIPHTKINY